MSLVSPQPKPTEQLAETPFDDAQADLILRSSDEVPVHFCVFGNILSLASQTFADMFRIPQKPHDGVQVVPLSACSTTLDIALRHIYPVRKTPPPKADTLHYAGVLAEFARKYQVEVLDQFVIGYLTDSLEHDPVGVYAIAVAYGYNDIGQNAARSCLNLTFSDLRSPYLQYTTGEHISELFRYHVACGEAASALASSDRSWLSPLTNDLVLKTCNSCSVIDCINPISPRSGGHGFHNYDSEDNDMGLLLTTRQNFRPTVCVDLLASFHPHSCTSPKSGSDYSGSICTGDL